MSEIVVERVAKALWHPESGDGPVTLAMRTEEVERVLPVAYPVVRAEVVAEVVEALRQESKGVRFVAAWRSAADFVEREFGRVDAAS